MAERRKLTKDALVRLKGPEGTAEQTIWDTDLKGFGVRLRGGGSRNFIVKFRVGGRSRQITIGPATVDGLASARTLAAKALQDARQGNDPQTARASRHEEARETLGHLIDAYLAYAEARLRPLSFIGVRRNLQQHIKPLHNRSLRSITTADVARRLDELTDTSGAVSSNRVRATLSALFTWGMKRGRVTANPVVGTGTNVERSRERILTPDELRAVWVACDQEDEFGRIVRLLILTGCRRQEVGDMLWSELSPDGTLWTIPAAKTKNKTAHGVALAPLAREILQTQPRRMSTSDSAGGMRPFVFGRDQRGYSGWTRARWRLDGRIAQSRGGRIADWTLHDLRRTFATVCADRLGIAPHIVEACLNHVQRRREGVAGIYNRATYAEPMALAWASYADWLQELVTGENAGSNVVALRR